MTTLTIHLLTFLYLFFILEQKIDDIALLHSITDEELKELIPLLGERKKFQIALQKNLAKTVTSSSTSTSENIMVNILYFVLVNVLL